MSRKQYSKELKLELVKKHLPIKEHKGLKAEISFSFYGCKKITQKLALTSCYYSVAFGTMCSLAKIERTSWLAM